MDRPLKEGQDRNLAKLIIGLKLLIKVLINFIKLQCEEQHFGSNENDCTTCNFSTLTVHYSDEQQVEPAAVCSKCTMLAEIIRSKHVKSNPNWSNYATAANRQWQLMKCYIEDYGYSETANVEKAGLKALVQICTNHVDVKRAIGNGLSYLLTILHIHDRVIHTKDTHVSDELLHECLTNIEEALKNIDDPQRNQYLEEIKTLMNDTKHITVQDDMKRCIWVLKTINRYITTLEHSSSCSTPVKTLKEIKISQYKHMHKICPDIIKDINKRRDKVERYMFVAEHLFNDTRPEYLCPAEPNNKKRNEELNHWYTHTMLGSISDFVIDINEKMGRISKDVQDRESIIMPRRQNPNDNETEQGELSHQRVNTGNDSHNNEELRDHQMSPQPEFQLPYQENEPDFFNCKRLVVAAIDIGTTYSCYAYSFSDEFQRDRLQIYLNNHWTDGNQMHTCRAPTVALFDKNESLHSFGYDAESTYNNLVETNEHIEWKYFRYFKMHLFSNKKVIQKDIHDSHGKPMPAIKLFASVISFFKVHLLTRLQQRDIGFKDTDIDWVLTVPTIWNDAARRFMLMAAKEAGIPENRISFAYETEAAAIYCKESFTTTARQQDREAGRFPFRTGDKFMVELWT
ncbi:uncharacterized protein LOC127855399 isoform X4 [Dreissena polymorpha]|uniref:uncharacterized protein LOC127855399 isoform X4 n=1 Tax=Dreissena polymorpha TaxID=45954 RepID=UPI002264206D|nr:uncharacterized protein LOC127855399 isoform X4 [Dreissena polymorpha]